MGTRLEEKKRSAPKGRCAFCAEKIARGWKCGRAKCEREYSKLYQRDRRTPSTLLDVVTRIPSGARVTEVLACGCRLTVPQSRGQDRRRCPNGHTAATRGKKAASA